MKTTLRTITLGLSLLASFCAAAQPKIWNTAGVTKQLQQPLSPNNTRPTAKTTATAERLVATSSYSSFSGSAQIQDSNSYYWSGGRGSVQSQSQGFVSVATDFCDQWQNWNINTGTFALSGKQMQTFDAIGNTLETTQMQWDNPSATFISSSKIIRTYTGKLMSTSLELTQDLSTKMLKNYQKRDLTYAAGKLTIEEYHNWDDASAAWIKSGLLEYDYSVASHIMITHKKWNTTSATWELSSQEDQILSGGNIIESTTKNWTTGAWVNFRLYKATYVGSDFVEWSQQEWNTTSNSWENTDKSVYTFAAGNPVRYEYFSWNAHASSWDLDWDILMAYSGKNLTKMESRSRDKASGSMLNRTQYNYNYNSSGNLILQTVNEWKSGGWLPVTFFHTRHFYYEPYTGIEEEIATIKKASLYPNPATTANVYVDYFTQQSEPTNVVLSNVLGQEILRKTEPASIGDHSVMIPVSSLSSGMYVVSIYCNGQLQKTMKLVK